MSYDENCMIDEEDPIENVFKDLYKKISELEAIQSELKETLINTDTLGIVYLKEQLNELKESFKHLKLSVVDNNQWIINNDNLKEVLRELIILSVISAKDKTKLLEKLDRQTENRQTEKKIDINKFLCGSCGKLFETYHDGDGWNTGYCQECVKDSGGEKAGSDSSSLNHPKDVRDGTLNQNSKPPEPPFEATEIKQPKRLHESDLKPREDEFKLKLKHIIIDILDIYGIALNEETDDTEDYECRKYIEWFDKHYKIKKLGGK